jgi:PsbP-like protein
VNCCCLFCIVSNNSLSFTFCRQINRHIFYIILSFYNIIINTTSQLNDLTICILSALLFTFIFEMPNTYAQDTTLQTFESAEFKVDYPATWEIAQKNSTFPYYGSDTIVVFKPIGETSPLNITYLNISPLRVGISIDNTTLTVSRDSLDEIVAKEIAFLQDPASFYGDLNVQILNNTATVVDGLPAKELTYVIHDLGTFDMETIVIHEGKQYQLHFTTPVSNVSETLPVVKQIIESFMFKA